MTIGLVTAPSGGYLQAVRDLLQNADDAWLCVAFAQARGVHLLTDELTALAGRGTARVLVTTTLGTSSAAAISALRACRADVRILNPGGATYHPKVFLGRRGDALRAVIGSANVTSGLVANVEVGTTLEGTLREPSLAQLWSWTETIWKDPRTCPWQPPSEALKDELLEPELLELLAAALQTDRVVYTLGPTPKPNLVTDFNASGIWVETHRSRKLQVSEGRAAAQFVTPAMLNLAWETLRARGRLTNHELLNELRVHRSSFVCGLLARLPGVEREPGRQIALRYREPM